jgi:RHS repeat-associated protein
MGALKLTYNQGEEALEKSSLFVVGALEVNGVSDKNRVRTYRYGFNGQEKDDEVAGNGNSYTATFWQYDTRLGRRWNVDPVYKSGISNYSVLSLNPIIMVDPGGDDDYYNLAGKYVGSDDASTCELRIISSKEAFESVKNNTSMLQKYSKIVTVEAGVNEKLKSLYTQSVSDKIERKAYFVLDTDKATLSLDLLPIETGDGPKASINNYEEASSGGENFIHVPGNVNKVIVGQAHGHPSLAKKGEVAIGGTSTKDNASSKTMGVPFYAIDFSFLHKTTPGLNNTSQTQSKLEKKNLGENVALDALDTYQEKK